MKGKITKIDTLKSSRNSGQAFTRIYFSMKRGEGDYFWAKTDVVPGFRNYKNWEPVLKVGNILDGLILKGTDTIDADSRPILIGQAPEEKPKVEEKKEIKKEQPKLF